MAKRSIDWGLISIFVVLFVLFATYIGLIPKIQLQSRWAFLKSINEPAGTK